jgi:predicted RNA binding protein YcfA (HicA-like mRNA interferase family)
VPKLSPISHKEFIKRMKKLGFEGPYPGGKHLFMIRENIRLTIPNPHKKEIGVDLLKRILKQAGISSDEWLSTE